MVVLVVKSRFGQVIGLKGLTNTVHCGAHRSFDKRVFPGSSGVSTFTKGLGKTPEDSVFLACRKLE
jgi:hypothetical protein